MVLAESARLEERVEVRLIDPNVRDAHHDVLPVVVDPQVATSHELVLQPQQPVTGHQEVPRILEQVEADQVACQQGLKQLKAVLEHAKDP